MQALPSNDVLSITELTESIRGLLEPAFAEIWVEGEISNLRKQSSGHCYFSLKDENAQIPAVLFRMNAMANKTPLKDGAKVVAFGRISVYAPRGSYQLICQYVLPSGRGSLAERFEQLKRKLEAEGLFERSRKKPLPVLPRRIGIITSPTGAALQDFLRILSRRGWKGSATILPARVQGDEAAGEIAAMLKIAGECGLFDVIVLARGGGSMEDLWPFNEEIVARAVAACPIPTISGVGHETDFTLSDFAADIRAETPSGAAELISSLRIEAEDAVNDAAVSMDDIFATYFDRRRAEMKILTTRLRSVSPQRQIENAHIRLDEISTRLNHAVGKIVHGVRNRLDSMAVRTQSASPAKNIAMFRQKLEQISIRLESANPDSILKRGYAIVRRENGTVVSDSAELSSGDAISIRLRDGDRAAEVR